MRRLLVCLARRSPGGLGTPLYGYYDPCARSSLNDLCPVGAGTQTRPGDRAVRLEPRTKTPLQDKSRTAQACLRRRAERRLCLSDGMQHSGTALRLSARRPPLTSSLGCILHREVEKPWLFEIFNPVLAPSP